jgi:hypothetical protein
MLLLLLLVGLPGTAPKLPVLPTTAPEVLGSQGIAKLPCCCCCCCCCGLMLPAVAWLASPVCCCKVSEYSSGFFLAATSRG